MLGTNRSHRDAAAVASGATSFRRRRWTAVIAAAALGLSLLTGCAAGQITQTSGQIPNHAGAHGRVGPVTVDNALLAVSDDPRGPAAYPAGSDVALTFWVTNRAIDREVLTSVTSSVGDVTLTGNATISPGSYLEVGGDSTITATITNTSEDLKYGFPVSVTFYFKDAGNLTLRVPMAIPGEREADRPSTNIYSEPETHIWSDSQ